MDGEGAVMTQPPTLHWIYTTGSTERKRLKVTFDPV